MLPFGRRSVRLFNESTLIVYIYPSLYIYSQSFVPNNDDHNNVFRVSVVGSEEFELIIYDRWERVFRTRDKYEGWDGNYKNGKPAEQAVLIRLCTQW